MASRMTGAPLLIDRAAVEKSGLQDSPGKGKAAETTLINAAKARGIPLAKQP